MRDVLDGKKNETETLGSARRVLSIRFTTTRAIDAILYVTKKIAEHDAIPHVFASGKKTEEAGRRKQAGD